MPNITFILPHWIYWGGLIAVPVFFMLAVRRSPPRTAANDVSLTLAYFFWVISGFMGIHRLYLKSWLAALYIILFIGIIHSNHQERLARNEQSIADNLVFNATYDLEQAQAQGLEDADIAKLQRDLEDKTASATAAAAKRENWRQTTVVLAAVILCMLIADAFLLPMTVRRLRRARQQLSQPPPDGCNEGTIAPAAAGSGLFSRAVFKLNALTGEFAAYWTVIAVFVFYYEVIARYIFNSPTVWAHESMFLMFGMQYMLAGGFCLRENAHVRVDVIYMHMSARRRAIADVCTSAFFFIFTISLMVTGWIFFSDSFDKRQVSFTEWEIAYWPIKFVLPLGGALIVLQGIAHLLRDIVALKTHGR